MLRPHREYPQFRPGLVPSGTAPSMNGPVGGGMNAPVNIPMNMTPSSYPPPPPGTGSFMRPPISGGHFAYPPPPPTPVPAPHLGPFLPPLQAAPFVPPLPPTPPVEAPPPPPPPPPPIASPLDDLSPPQSNPVERSPTKHASLLLPSEPSKPRDVELLKNIEDMAEFVVKNGPRYESMARAKHAGDPKFAFLFESDSCPEAVIHRDYYKWKKDVLQLQSEAAMEVKSGKRLESVIVSSPSRGLSLKAQQEEGTLGSPTLSDMDMEEGLDAQSPRRDSTKLSSGQESDSPEKVSALNQSSCPDVLANEVCQPVDSTENLNRGKQAQCRLTGDYTGSLIDNYMSDISEDSEDLEPAGDLEIAESIEATAQESKKGSKLPQQECVEPGTALVNASFSEATEHLGASEADEQNVMELQGSEDPITCPVSVSSPEATVHLSSSKVDEQKVVEPQKSEDRGEEQGSVECENGSYRDVHNVNGSQNLRKSRSPSETISKSPSKSQNESPVKTRSRSRSASPSNKAKSKSPSPSSSALQDTLGRLRPKDFSGKDANQGVFELTTRPKTEAKRGANICVNYARGRCFRGDSCRLQHQVSGKVLQEEERVLEQEQNGPSKLTDPTPNAEKDEAQKMPENVEVVATRKTKRTDPSPNGKKDELQKTRGNVEVVVATKKAKRKAVSGKAEDSPQGKVAKRQESIREAAIIPEVASQEDVAIKQDISQSKNAGQPTSALEGRAAVDAATKGDLLHVKASQASEVGAWFPLPPSETGSQVTGNYGSSRFHNQDSLQSSGFPEVRPSVLTPINNTYATSNNEADRLYAKKYPVVPTQFSSAGPADKSGFQHPPYGNPGMIPSAAASRNPTQEYTNLAQNFTPSYSKEYGLPSQTQSGSSQNMLVPPPPVYPPIVQQRDFSVDASRGYSSLQHGLTSPFSLQAQPQKSLNPSYSGGPSRQSSFSDIANREPLSMYPKSSLTFSSQSPGYTTWVNSGSSGFSSSAVPEVPPVLGQSSSYSYSLTTIPPLPSIIELPGASKPSNPSDQYDPLSDSLEPSSIAGSKSSSFNLLKTVEDMKPLGAFGKTLASQLENVSPAFDAMKGDPAEVAGDPVVGVVENVSPPEEKRLWSPGPMVEVADPKQDQLSSKNKKNNARGLKLLRSAVADQVKDVLKPTWKEGRMSKDAFKNIVKKAVDKVTAAIPSHHIPKSQEKVDQFISSSRTKIAKLVQGYIDKYQKT